MDPLGEGDESPPQKQHPPTLLLISWQKPESPHLNALACYLHHLIGKVPVFGQRETLHAVPGKDLIPQTHSHTTNDRSACFIQKHNVLIILVIDIEAIQTLQTNVCIG